MKGEVIGITSSLMSASLVVAPVIAGLLFEWNDVLPYVFARSPPRRALIIYSLRCEAGSGSGVRSLPFGACARSPPRPPS